MIQEEHRAQLERMQQKLTETENNLARLQQEKQQQPQQSRVVRSRSPPDLTLPRGTEERRPAEVSKPWCPPDIVVVLKLQRACSNVTWILIPEASPYLSRVCYFFSSLFHSRVVRFSPLTEKSSSSKTQCDQKWYGRRRAAQCMTKKEMCYMYLFAYLFILILSATILCLVHPVYKYNRKKRFSRYMNVMLVLL